MAVAVETVRGEAESLSPKAQLRQWIVDQVDGKAEVDTSDLLNKAVDHFLKDQVFLRRFLKEMLRPILYHFVHQELVKGRGSNRIVSLGSILTDKDAVKKRAAKLQSKWSGWLERTQAGTQKALLAMTREELQFAVKLRMNDIAVLEKRVEFESELVSRLKPGEMVGTLGVETIEAIAKKYGL